MVQQYSCTLEAQSDVVVSTLVGGRIKTIYASEGEQLSEGSLVLSLDAEQANVENHWLLLVLRTQSHAR